MDKIRKSVIARILSVVCALVLAVFIPFICLFSPRTASAQAVDPQASEASGVHTSATQTDFSYEFEFSYKDFLAMFGTPINVYRNFVYGQIDFKVHLDFAFLGRGYKIYPTYFIKYSSGYLRLGTSSASLKPFSVYNGSLLNNITTGFDDYIEVIFPSGSSVSEVLVQVGSSSSSFPFGVFFDNSPITINNNFNVSGVFAYQYSYSINSLTPPPLTESIIGSDSYPSYVRVTPSLFSSTGDILLLHAITIPVPFNNVPVALGAVSNKTITTPAGIGYINSALLEGGDYSKGFTNGYDEGYDVGYSAGYSEGEAYGSSEGYNKGYSSGSSDGYSTGFSAGIASANEYTFLGLMGAVFDAPIKAITSLLDFEVLGFNMSTFALSLLTICVVLKIVSLISGG